MKTPKEYTFKELVDTITELNQAYYGGGNSPVSDAEYDALVAELFSRDSKHVLLELIGDDRTETATKFKHPKPMLSLAKVHEQENGWTKLKEWQAERPLVMQPKLDGLTLVLYYDKGQLIHGVTRGNGNEGDIVPQAKLEAMGVPSDLNCSCTGWVRGEVIVECVYKKDIEKLGYANLRAAAVGLLRNTEARKEDGYLTFRAFDSDFPDAGFFSESMRYRMLDLSNLGFLTVPTHEMGDKTYGLLVLRSFFDQWSVSYPIDGLVFKLENYEEYCSVGSTAHHPKNALAFKFEPESKETTIRDIIWQAGRTGILTPVAEFDPVELEGTTVTRATLNNARGALKAPIGSRVIVCKAGEIIPHIKEVKEKGDGDFGDINHCPYCGADTLLESFDGVANLKCTNPHCLGIATAKLLYAMGREALDIKGMGQKQCEELVQLVWRKYESEDATSIGYNPLTVLWLAVLTGVYDTEILQLNGGKKILKNLLARRKDVMLVQIITAMQVPNVGKVKAMDLARRYSDLDSFLTLFHAELLSSTMDGIGSTGRFEILNWLKSDPTLSFVRTARIHNELPNVKGLVSSEGKLAGKSTCITGTLSQPREIYENIIISKGGIVKSSVSRKTDYLIVGDDPGATKLNKAKLCNVPCISEKELLELLNG